MTKIGKVYGGALYDLATEEQLEDVILQQLTQINDIMKQNPDYAKLLDLPSVPKAQRCALLDEALRGSIELYLLNFLKILAEKGAVHTLPACLKEYRNRYNTAHGILEATAITAVALSEAQCATLKAKLEAMTGKTIHLANKVESDCLGGIRLEMAGTELDGTVQARLERLRRALAATV